MQVVKSSPSTISLDKLRERLREEDGILLWEYGPTWKFLKGTYQSVLDGNDYSYGWVSLYFDRGYDCTKMQSVSSIEELVKFISKRMEEKGNRFYWFSTERDFVNWIHEIETNGDY